ncbi:MATE family efflux transporter [Tepiditoga spiralis]|uniref:Multidrug-efflux transporter n=1 Tax=Tepiditoga spiralis TaxID=2108365 RepID=A0A7G1G8P6_9BACT|nr:MATE family efflux transporter [Tepiditoga spiralis]BBE31337.1 MATE family efflux transporter [Tepiditoga spiralis]
MLKKMYIKEILLISFPLIIQNTFRMFLGTTDKIFVGQLGEKSLAAVGGANQLFSLFIIVFFSFSSGLTILASQYKGSKNNKKLEEIISTSFFISLIFGVFLLITLETYSKSFLSWIKIKEDTLTLANNYFKIIIPSVFVLLFSSNCASIFNAFKKNKFSMIATIVSMITNIFLDYLLIFVFNFGIKGAAYATLISRILEFLILFIFLIYIMKVEKIKLKIYVNMSSLKNLVNISLPMSIDGAVWQFATTVNTAIIFKIGVSEAAIFEVIKIFQTIVLTPISAIAGASIGIIGNELGKNKKENAKSISINTIFISFIIVTILISNVMIFKNQIFSLFNLKQTTIQEGKKILNIIIFLVYAQTLNIIFPFILRSGGDTWSILGITIFGFWIIQIPISLLFAFTLHLGITGLMYAMLLAEIFKGTLFLLRYLKWKWMKNITIEVKK